MMNLLLYLILLKIVLLYITPIINCDSYNKIFVCNNNILKTLYNTTNNAKTKLPCLPMSPSCFNNKKPFKKKEVKKKPKYNGPEIADLIQSGVQETIKSSKKSTDRNTYMFYETKNVFMDIPFPNKHFNFQAFAPDNFLTMRNLFKISEDFDTSFQTSKVQTVNSNEDFMETYYYTGDYKFYINIISIETFEFIVSFLSKYFSHFCENKLSLLPKIAGLFHLKHKNFELYFIVKPYIFPNIATGMENVYYTKGIPEKGFLKMDTRFNNVGCHEEQDIKFLFRKGLIIPSHTYSSFHAVLIKDTNFLNSLDISDYIFMFSLNPSNKHNEKQSALVNILRDVTDPDPYDKKLANVNLIAYVGIDNIYKKRNKADQSYHKFYHLNCKFTHQVNQNVYYHGERLVNFITRLVFKSNGK